MAKLKRVMSQVKKQDRRKKRDTDQNFAAIQLLQDPQVGLHPLRGCVWSQPGDAAQLMHVIPACEVLSRKARVMSSEYLELSEL